MHEVKQFLNNPDKQTHVHQSKSKISKQNWHLIILIIHHMSNNLSSSAVCLKRQKTEMKNLGY